MKIPINRNDLDYNAAACALALFAKTNPLISILKLVSDVLDHNTDHAIASLDKTSNGYSPENIELWQRSVEAARLEKSDFEKLLAQYANRTRN